MVSLDSHHDPVKEYGVQLSHFVDVETDSVQS